LLNLLLVQSELEFPIKVDKLFIQFLLHLPPDLRKGLRLAKEAVVKS
jgi:hypothetical protein